MLRRKQIYQAIKRGIQLFKSCLYSLNGKKPWSYGYSEYKALNIEKILRERNFDQAILNNGYGFRLDERIVEYAWFLSRLPETNGKLLDAGSVLNFEYILKDEKLRSKQIFISTLAPEASCYWTQGISYIYEDLRDSGFRNDYFDWVVSLSTIEHIGLDNTMLYTTESTKNENSGASCLVAIKEYWRMLKPGGVLFLSFPYGRHENHGWFQIFDAEMLDQVINTFSPKSCQESHYRYEPEGWRVSSRETSKNATYFDIHKQKTYDNDYAAASRAIVCLELIK